MIAVLLATIGFCAGDPGAAEVKFREAYLAALKATSPGVGVTVDVEAGLAWKAVTYIAPVIGLRTTLRIEWLCEASDDEIVHVARHEADRSTIEGSPC